MTVKPWIATAWNYSEDGLVYDLTIREGVKFHDGTDLTAEDVAFSINRQLLLGKGRGYVLAPHVNTNVTAIEDYKVRIWLKHTFGPFMSALSGWYVVNMDLVVEHSGEGTYGEWGDFAELWLLTNDAGSGAYKVKDFILEEKLVMEKYEDYWAGFAPKAPDIVEMLAGTEPITVRLMMANRELEFTDPWQTLENMVNIKEIEGVRVSSIMATVGNWNLMMNTKKPPLDDVHFRRALAYCLPYETVVEELFPGSVYAVGPINQAMAGFDPTVTTYEYDLEKAAAELALSKYASNYTDYEVDLYWVAEVPDEEKVAMLLMSEANKIDIIVNVLRAPWTTVVHDASMLETSPHIVYIGAGGDFPEAGSYLINRYHSDTAASWRQNEWLLNETLDAMIEDSLMTMDYDERMEKYKVMQQYLADYCPTIWLYVSASMYAMPDYVTTPWETEGEWVKSSPLGEVYLYVQDGGMNAFRLWEIDRLIDYEG